MSFEDLEDRITEVDLGAKLNVVAAIPGDFYEEFIKVLDQFRRWEPIILGMVFLLEDDSIQAEANYFHGWLVKLLGEILRIKVGVIFHKPGPSPNLPGNDPLRNLQQRKVIILDVRMIAFGDLKVPAKINIAGNTSLPLPDTGSWFFAKFLLKPPRSLLPVGLGRSVVGIFLYAIFLRRFLVLILLSTNSLTPSHRFSFSENCSFIYSGNYR